MTRRNVNSSNIKSIGYDSSAKTLEIEFVSGSIYEYSSVAHTDYSALMGASSHGQYFNANIKNSFSYKKVR